MLFCALWLVFEGKKKKRGMSNHGLTSSSSSSSTSNIPESSSERGLPPDRSTSVPDPASLRNLHPLPARCCRVSALSRELLTCAWKTQTRKSSSKYLCQTSFLGIETLQDIPSMTSQKFHYHHNYNMQILKPFVHSLAAIWEKSALWRTVITELWMNSKEHRQKSATRFL